MTLKTPLPSLVLLEQPSLMEELTSSRETMDLATKHVSKKVCEWYETWRPWQQRMLLCGLTDRCSNHQLETLATTLEPVFHRDFITTVKQRYPSAPFRHMKKREEQKQKVAEQKRLALGYKDEYHEKFPETMPLLAESDLALFTSLVHETDVQPDVSELSLISHFSEQLSARLLINVINTLKAEPDLFNIALTGGDSERWSPDAMLSADSPPGSRDSPDEEVVSPIHSLDQNELWPDDLDRKLSLITEEASLRAPSPKLEIYEENLPTPQDANSSPNDSVPRPATISDPLKKRKPKRKNTPGVQVLDLPPLKVIEHRHRSAVGTASDIATVDFFLGEKAEKLGFMQRELRRGPVRKPNSIHGLLVPLQKCYKHVKLCSENKAYIRAHRSKLQGQFKRQLRQIWEWIREWQDYERLVLLSDITKLCNSQMIEYLCECLTTRLRDRMDVDSLSDELMLRVLEYLDYDEINNAAKVCSRWRYLCNLDQLWQRKCKQIGRAQGLPNINRIIVKTRRKSKLIDWKLAFLEILRITEEEKNSRPKPSFVEYEDTTPEGMMRIDGKFFPNSPSEDGSSIDDRLQRRRLSVSTVLPRVKRGTIFFLRDQGLGLIDEDDDSESYIDYNEYSIFRDDDDKSRKSRRRQRAQSVYGSSFDVSGRTRYEHCKDHTSEDDDGVSEQAGPRLARRKKRRHEEEEPALDIRPELRQARDLLNTNVPRRTLVWKESNRPELKQKTAKFAGEVKSVQRVRKLQGHLDSVLCIAISKRRMISGSMDRSIRIWDLNSGKSIHKLYGHMGGVRCLHFEGSLLVSGSWDMQAMVWDLVKFDRRAILSGHRGSISCVQFNTKYLLTASHDKTVRVYCMRGYDLHRVVKGHSKEITGMKIDGMNVVTASSDKTVRMTNLETGECLRTFEVDEHVVSICLQNDLLIVGNGLGQCHFLNKQTGSVEAGIVAHKGAVNQVLIHKNRFFTCSTDSTVKEWDLVTMTCIRYLQGPRGAIRDLKVDDKHIISCGDDGNIRIWDIYAQENELGSAHGDIVASAVVKTTS